jgi:hypothetical protein
MRSRLDRRTSTAAGWDEVDRGGSHPLLNARLKS